MCKLKPKAQKRKREDDIRVATINAQGLENPTKRQRLDKLIKNEKIDIAFIEEGSRKYHNAIAEYYTDDSGNRASTSYCIDPMDIEMQALMGRSVIAPNGGTQRKTPYNAVYDPTKFEMVPDTVAVNYNENPDIRNWIRQPLTQALQEGTLELGGTSRRQGFKPGPALTEIRRKVQQRVDMLGQQRPKCLKSIDGEQEFYFYHAPLGAMTTMKEVGLDSFGTLGASAAFGAGGELASAAVGLFAMHMGYDRRSGKVKPLPPGTVVAGDLNVRGDGMDFVWTGANRATCDDDELCHVITSGPMTVVSTNRSDCDTDIQSDHNWVIVDMDTSK